jgi:hypothetical protein
MEEDSYTSGTKFLPSMVSKRMFNEVVAFINLCRIKKGIKGLVMRVKKASGKAF